MYILHRSPELCTHHTHSPPRSRHAHLRTNGLREVWKGEKLEEKRSPHLRIRSVRRSLAPQGDPQIDRAAAAAAAAAKGECEREGRGRKCEERRGGGRSEEEERGMTGEGESRTEGWFRLFHYFPSNVVRPQHSTASESCVPSFLLVVLCGTHLLISVPANGIHPLTYR